MSTKPSTTKNIKIISGVTVYNVNTQDDIINIDTSTNSVDIYLPNIKGSGLRDNPKEFCINDNSNNASVNNITIHGVGGDLVNGTNSTIIDKDNGSAISTICKSNEWLVSKDTDATSISPALNEVLQVGNFSGGNNILLTTNDRVEFGTSDRWIGYDNTINDYIVFQNKNNGFLFGKNGANGTDGGFGFEISNIGEISFIGQSNLGINWTNSLWTGTNPSLRVEPLNQTSANIQKFQNASGTIALTSQLTGNGIFDNSNNGGNTPSSFNVGITDNLTFGTKLIQLDETNKRVAINTTNTSTNVGFRVLATNNFGTYIDGYSTSHSGYILKLRNFDGTNYTDLNRFRSNGKVELSLNGGETRMGTSTNYLRHYVQTTTQFSSTATYSGFHANRNGSGIAIRGSSRPKQYIDSTDTMIFGTGWNNNSTSYYGVEAMRIDGNNQNISIGTSITSGARFTVRGVGNTSATNLVRFESNSGLSKFIQNDAGQISINAPSIIGNSILQATGDIEVIGNNNGQILPDRLGSGARVRIYAEKNASTGVWNTFLEEVI